jgi:Flp pilus assembly protein TadG
MMLMQRLRRFGGATKGLAALEFAILLPMMVFLLFGSIDLIDVLGANRRSQNVAASLADAVARDTEVSDDEVAGMWAALDVLMVPDDDTGLNVRITSIEIVSAASARVVWSEAHGMSALVANDPIVLPDAMMTPGTSIVLAETEYSYDAPLGILFTGAVHLDHNSYRRSRLVDPIPRV